MTPKVLTSTQISKSEERFAEIKSVPGGGKTYTLIQRLLHLLFTGVPATKILVLSHSNASVAEVRNRMDRTARNSATDASSQRRPESVDANLSDITVQTAHAFAFSFIKGKRPPDKKESCELLAKAIKAVRRDCKNKDLWPDVSSDIRQRRLTLLDELSDIQNGPYILRILDVARASRTTMREVVSISQFASLAPYVRILTAVRRYYAKIKKQCGVIDFGDMLHLATTAIRNGASMPYTHILVDEYQDCSPAQVHLLAELAQLDGCSIMAFGDPDQAIYGFGGSSYTPLSSVIDGVTEIRLPHSRRLHAKNAALASAIAQHSSDQVIQTNRDGEMPVLICADTETEQINRVAQDIKEQIDSGVQPEQIVVLARKNMLLTPIDQELLALGVLTERNGQMRNHKHALRVLHMVHVMERFEKSGTDVTPEELKRAFKWSAEIEDHHWADESKTLKKLLRVPSLEGRYRLCAKSYLRLHGGVRRNKDLRADVNRWEPICRAHRSARSMRDAVRAMDTRAVVTGTIHSVKGGEWDNVFVVGVTDGHLPDYRSSDERSLREERRLLYVAVTRAREIVRLYHSPASDARSRRRFEKPSSFLNRRVLKTLSVE